MCRFVASLPPRGRAIWAVSWAGEAESENWMDVGREYTERWHHQQQIRDAVGRPLLLEPRWIVPLLNISVRVWPHACRHVTAPDGTRIRLAVGASPDTVWTLVRTATGWDLDAGPGTAAPAAEVAMSEDTAWRMFYNALPSGAIDARVRVTGDASLAAPLLAARSIVV